MGNCFYIILCLLGKYMYLENLILKNYRTKETELYMKAF
jgi:hypothetical protein